MLNRHQVHTYKDCITVMYICESILLMSEVTLITACPIEGQIRKKCASHPGCHQTCNTTEPVACPAVCIVNGCECPDGTVIDEDKNKCIAPSECEGTQL